MRWSRTVTIGGGHAEGAAGRVITGGVLPVPGATLLERMIHLNSGNDAIRRFGLFEARGSAQMTANLLLPPRHPEAQREDSREKTAERRQTKR